MTYYEVLEISINASPEVIEASWKALMRVYHPDAQSKLSERAKTEKAKLINEAHEVLSDPVKRKAYDQSQTGHATTRRAPQHEYAGFNRAAYPEAYPPAYDLRSFQPERVIEEFVQESDIANVVKNALLKGGSHVLDKIISENPIVGDIVDHALKLRREARKKTG